MLKRRKLQLHHEVELLEEEVLEAEVEEEVALLEEEEQAVKVEFLEVQEVSSPSRGGRRGGSTGGRGASSKGGTRRGSRRSNRGRRGRRGGRRCDIRCKVNISLLTNMNLLRDDLADVAYFVRELREAEL